MMKVYAVCNYCGDLHAEFRIYANGRKQGRCHLCRMERQRELKQFKAVDASHDFCGMMLAFRESCDLRGVAFKVGLSEAIRAWVESH